MTVALAAALPLLAMTFLTTTGAPANGATLTRTGTLIAGGPTMPVVFINGVDDTCTGQGVSPVLYDVAAWTAPIGGTVEFKLTSTPTNVASFYIYKGKFDPEDGMKNCVAADNSEDNPGNETIITLDVEDEVTYRLVAFDDSFDQEGGTYQIKIEVPGGKATDPAKGSGRKYVKLPKSFSCGDLNATITWKGKADKVESAVIKAGRRTVANLNDNKITPSETTTLRHLPANTKKLTATLKLKQGGKVAVKRTYTRC